MSTDPATQASTLLALLEQAVTKLGMEIRHEPIIGPHATDGSSAAGGVCTVGGIVMVFIDPNAPIQARLLVLKKALQNSPANQIYLPPLVRDYLEK